MHDPGVRFPPPFVYAAGILIGWLLHRWWPLPMTAPDSLPRELAAFVFIAIWLALMLSAFAVFRRVRTAIIPNKPARAVVTGGPYRFTRNPMYASLVALYLGLTLVLNSWWPFFLLPLVVVVIQQAVIAREERYLSGAFPDEYAAYRRRVRRWL